MEMNMAVMTQVLKDMVEHGPSIKHDDVPGMMQKVMDPTYIYHAKLLREGGYIKGHDYGTEWFKPTGITLSGHQLLSFCGDDDFGTKVWELLAEAGVPATPEIVRRLGHRLVTEQVEQVARNHSWITAADTASDC